MQDRLANWTLILSFSCLLPACQHVAYEPKPLTPEASVQQLFNQDINNPDFIAFLKQNGVHSPVETWDINTLTLCALFFNPKIKVAKAQWAAAEAAIDVEGVKPSPSIGATLGHSNRVNEADSPWALGLSMDIPIETHNKRAIKVSQARYLSEATRVEVAQTAWQLRGEIANQLLAYQTAALRIGVLEKIKSTQDDMLAMIAKRLDVGLASKTEYSLARIQQQKAIQALEIARRAPLSELRAQLAASIGLSAEKFTQLKLKPLALNAANTNLSIKDNRPETLKRLQQEALTNRLDIRAALARYQAAEESVKLEIAKQYPDFHLSPSYAFDFGDSIWSLGINYILSFSKKNNVLIDKSIKLREVEAAEFLYLQSKIINELAQHFTAHFAAEAVFDQAVGVLNRQNEYMHKLEKQYNKGYIDRLELTSHKLLTAEAELNVFDARVQAMRQAILFESAYYKPLLYPFDNLTNPDATQ